MNKIRKSGIALFLSAALLMSGVATFSTPMWVFSHAEEGGVVTREQVKTLEELRETPVEQIAAWEQYNSRDYDIVTSVKDQGNTTLCWVYGSLAAMETNILRQGFSGKTKDELDLDEEEFAKATKGKWDDPLDLADSENNGKTVDRAIWNAEGAICMATQFASRGQGVYEEGEINSEIPEERYSSYFLRNAITCENDVSAIKMLIAEYGGVAFTYNSGLINYTYFYAKGTSDHASFIVGWDDTIPAREFRDTYGNAPQRDGGWIVKNSYGASTFDEGYCYLSYDSVLSEITAFDMMSATEYDWCYNYSDKLYSTKTYSTCSPTDEQAAEYAAIYRAQKGEDDKEFLKAVSVGVAGVNIQVSVSVYANVDEAAAQYGSSAFDPKQGTLVATTTCTAPTTGIYTIPLPERAELLSGSYFTVLVQLSGGSVVYDNFAYRSGKTRTYVLDAGKWNDLSSPFGPLAIRGVLCIKALTVNGEEEKNYNISDGMLELSDSAYVYNGSAHTPEVTVTLDGEVVSSENYTVAYENNINAGTATVTVTGTGDYTGSLQANFEIAKADSPMLPEELEHLVAEAGAEVLSEVELPEHWEWFDPDTELVAGVMQVSVVYVGEDRGNYVNTVFQVVLTVPEPEDPDEGEEPPAVEPEDPDEGEEPPAVEPEDPDEGEEPPAVEPEEPDDGEEPPAVDPEDPDNGGSNVGLWIGISVGACAAFVAVGSVVFVIIRKKKS